jgi:hypothetical protein
MSSPPPSTTPNPLRKDPPPIKLDPLAGVLSYLIPGLGQISQGRIAKGIVFFVALYSLFFYGMALGQMKNVYLPDAPVDPKAAAQRPPAIQRLFWDIYSRPHFAGQFFIGIAAWPAVIQYHFYDKEKQAGPIFGTFERTPSDEEINTMQRNSNKSWDLGWVYTVIAGVLNILVIYDAIAGPAFREVKTRITQPPATPAEATAT